MSCIPEILKRKGNGIAVVKDGLVIEGGGHYKGYDWLVTFNDRGFRCGYVALSPDHPLYEKDMYEMDNILDVHGGVTFYKQSHIAKKYLGHACEDMWVGFDAGHCNDIPDVEKASECFPYLREVKKDHLIRMSHMFEALLQDGTPNNSLKDFAFMENECRSVIEQLIEKAA